MVLCFCLHSFSFTYPHWIYCHTEKAPNTFYSLQSHTHIHNVHHMHTLMYKVSHNAYTYIQCTTQHINLHLVYTMNTHVTIQWLHNTHNIIPHVHNTRYATCSQYHIYNMYTIPDGQHVHNTMCTTCTQHHVYNVYTTPRVHNTTYITCT